MNELFLLKIIIVLLLGLIVKLYIGVTANRRLIRCLTRRIGVIETRLPVPEQGAVVDDHSEIAGPDTCPVCLESMDDDATDLLCGHALHEQCWLQLLEQTNQCPVCRREDARYQPETSQENNWTYD